jgi:hypothetical protein
LQHDWLPLNILWSTSDHVVLIRCEHIYLPIDDVRMAYFKVTVQRQLGMRFSHGQEGGRGRGRLKICLAGYPDSQSGGWSGGQDLNLRQSGFCLFGCMLGRLVIPTQQVGVYSVFVCQLWSLADSEALPS